MPQDVGHTELTNYSLQLHSIIIRHKQITYYVNLKNTTYTSN